MHAWFWKRMKNTLFFHSTWKANTKSIWSKAVGFTLYTNAPMTRQSQPCAAKWTWNRRGTGGGRRGRGVKREHTHTSSKYISHATWSLQMAIQVSVVSLAKRVTYVELYLIWLIWHSIDFFLLIFYSLSLSLLSLEYSNDLLRTSAGIIQDRF